VALIATYSSFIWFGGKHYSGNNSAHRLQTVVKEKNSL